MTTEQVHKYYNSLLSIYDTMTATLAQATERGQKVAQKLANDVSKGQREALELGRLFAAEPIEPAQHYTALFDATTRAQGRALAFAQAAYDEGIGAAGEARQALEKLVEANRTASEAALELVREWSKSMPFAETWRTFIDSTKPVEEPVAV